MLFLVFRYRYETHTFINRPVILCNLKRSTRIIDPMDIARKAYIVTLDRVT